MHAHHHHHPCPPVPATYPGLLTLFGSTIALASATLWGGARVVKRVVEGSLWHSGDYGHAGHCGCHHHHYTVECRPPCGCHSHGGCCH